MTLANEFMDEHKIKYRDETTSKDCCIQQLARYSGTILRRDICPRVTLRMKVAELDEDGNKIRRRNASGKFDERYNVIEIDDSDVESTSDDGNLTMVVTPEVSKSVATNNSVDAYKKKIKEYALKWKADGNGNFLPFDHIDDVSILFMYGSLYIIQLN